LLGGRTQSQSIPELFRCWLGFGLGASCIVTLAIDELGLRLIDRDLNAVIRSLPFLVRRRVSDRVIGVGLVEIVARAWVMLLLNLAVPPVALAISSISCRRAADRSASISAVMAPGPVYAVSALVTPAMSGAGTPRESTG
jgi:hypothetical protein